ncbi:hypothetical protein Y032_0134g1827 [Ancylostoma ceylanicum]|uniref:Uncharacterized protein n=1 Tax=Ancylostoma ceylanicum TaxID=53326 RepID=A0A016T622_9BILA|nr:hypothetical protein Y032_0134g1827 [Ancylostoma ceylanicum]
MQNYTLTKIMLTQRHRAFFMQESFKDDVRKLQCCAVARSDLHFILGRFQRPPQLVARLLQFGGSENKELIWEVTSSIISMLNHEWAGHVVHT